MKKLLITTFAIVAMAGSAMAGDLKVGTGGPTGNYFGMANDIKSYCEAELGSGLEIINSGGSIDNLVGMGNKKFSAGLVQEDVLQYMAKKDPNVNQNRLKIISGMHSETVHLLIPKGYEPEGSGSMWSNLGSMFGGGGNAAIDINLLKNQTVGSWGGSMVSATALSYFQNLNLNIVELGEKDRAAPNIPMIIVGGQPYAPVEKYLASGKYHLVGIDYEQVRAQAPFYLKASANYGKTATVDTIAVRALLIGKAFRKESRNSVMTKMAGCIDANLPDLADDSDTNPNWNSVYEFQQAGASTNWAYFKLQ